MAKPLFGLAFGPHSTAYLDRMSPGKIRAQIVKKARALILRQQGSRLSSQRTRASAVRCRFLWFSLVL
jgi:hypothetical protein